MGRGGNSWVLYDEDGEHCDATQAIEDLFAGKSVQRRWRNGRVDWVHPIRQRGVAPTEQAEGGTDG